MSVRHQEFVYDDCDFHVAVMNKSLLVDSKRGAEMRGQAVALTFRLPPGGVDDSEKVCVKVIDKKETVQLFFDRWPEKSTVLKAASLPPVVGGYHKTGRGGHALWSGTDCGMQYLVRFVRGPVSTNETACRNHILSERLKAMGLAGAATGPAPRGKALPRKLPKSDDREAASVARMSGEGIGPGYLVAGKFWVAKDFSRVIKVACKTDTWYPEPFTCTVLEVLLGNMSPAGMSSKEICDAATEKYKVLVQEAKNTGVELPPPPRVKSLGQFFRVKATGGAVHEIYGAIKRIPGLTPHYLLKWKWVAKMRQG